MEIMLECLPCILKQALDISMSVTSDGSVRKKIMDASIGILAGYEKYGCVPELAFEIQEIVKKYSLSPDPYAEIKERDISAALRLYPKLARNLENSHDKLYCALMTSAAGNMIDAAINSCIDLEKSIDAELGASFSICDIQVFKDKLRNADSLLIIGDNAGETVFDRILAYSLSFLDITYAVRSSPVINDATAEDAYASGLDAYAKIIPSGCGAPGTIIEKCSPSFLAVFNEADIVISKGQGNFEALSGCGRDIFFLLKAKCPMISGRLGVGLNDYVFRYMPASH